MNTTTHRLRASLALLVIALIVATLAVSTADTAKANNQQTSLDSSKRTACVVWNSGVPMECFSSETELLAQVSKRASGPVTMASSSSCSSALRLYDGTGYSGSVLYVYQRHTWINLSGYGWSNRASSFKVGACDSRLADGSNGGGGWYPTYLSEAWDKSSNMLAWGNRVSSVYLK